MGSASLQTEFGNVAGNVRPLGSEARGRSSWVSEDAGSRWYVVQTQPHNEGRAITNLHRQGFMSFNPCVRRTVSHARKKSTVLAPLFPNYVFVQFDPSRDQWRCINGTFGVVRLIANGEVPSSVPDGVITALRARIGDDGAMDWTVSLHVGDLVRVTEGPFMDLVGTLEHLDAAGRVRVLLDMLGRSVSVVMAGNAVAPKS
jgi:transcriptional antiterminator RfaH